MVYTLCFMAQVLVTFFAVTIPDLFALVCFPLFSTRRTFYSVGKVPLILIVGYIARITHHASRITFHIAINGLTCRILAKPLYLSHKTMFTLLLHRAEHGTHDNWEMPFSALSSAG